MTKVEMKLIGFLSIAFALFIIAGGPLVVLQGVAWASMIQEYSKNDSLTNAVQKTFSGKHPCSLCKKIEKESKKKQKTTALLKTDKSLKVALSITMEKAVFLFSKKISYSKPLPSTYKSITYDPPEPYPRGLVTT
ncbi:MAG: hypothetical protein K2W99_02160 [Chthoniobacterales bacterium]|nr:hypothetical protein [Chthoniobacterales bacterium]